MAAPFSTRVVDRLSGAIAARSSRRGFLVRSALAGTALAVAPTDFILKPTTAYAAICGCSGSSCDCGSLCCDGYTEFCCTLTGVNACPGGTALGGWWKADGSGFCGGGPRYYMDCNVVPGANPCSCGCANGDCGNRKSCCTHFRYGQCHQEISGMGAIMCRVVSCTPPWVLDGTCTTLAATDQATLGHDRPCLENAIGGLDVVTRPDPTHLRVAGWAADGETDNSIDVHVYVDGVGAAITTANLRRDDIDFVFNTYGPNHGYDVTFPISASAQNVCVYAISQGSGSNATLGCRPIAHDPFGSLDVVSVGPNGLRVAGWALDPDSTSPVAVHVYVDGTFATATTAAGARSDIGSLYPAYGSNHGYDITFPISASAKNVCVYAINQGTGNNVQLGCRALQRNPFGSLDLAMAQPGGVRVAGWAIDPDTTGPIAIHVYVDGTFAGAASATADRSDLAPFGYGNAHGFDTTVGAAAGSRNVCVYAINSGGGTGNTLLGCRTVQVGGNPIGSLDLVQASGGGVRVAGWALDRDTSDPITVHVYVDGAFAAAITANTSRPDVGAQFGYGDDHGFDQVIAPVGSGTHNVCAYAINTGSGTANTVLGCRSVTVP